MAITVFSPGFCLEESQDLPVEEQGPCKNIRRQSEPALQIICYMKYLPDSIWRTGCLRFDNDACTIFTFYVGPCFLLIRPSNHAGVLGWPLKVLNCRAVDVLKSAWLVAWPCALQRAHLLSILCAISDFLAGIPQGRSQVRTLHNLTWKLTFEIST